jgi:nucleotide-binding universal stress UspA family protein
MPGTIVVGYDGAEIAQRALARAIDEARKSSASLVVVAVVEMPLNAEGLQNFGTQVETAGLTADYVWAAGEPAGEILGIAKERHATLIVVGSHHHGFFSRLLGADVTGEVQRDAGCDVIAVP